MNKQTIINRLEALDLSQYPYFEIKELIREQNGNILKKKKRINSLLSTIYPLFLYPEPGSNRHGG